ncbi:MAG: Rpn family recombination-promoting nuclease/putative transposase [Synergistaceae bacterium]|nr:Rpn family recombination-promoting nuclease/putative transposase [Synergistaceae bacterium]
MAEKLNNLDEDALKLAKIRQSCLMDDGYMQTFFKNNIKCTQLVLRIILDKDDLTVKRVKTQKPLKGAPNKRTVRLDIYAVDSEGLEYDIEIQRENAGASPKRARFYSALIDANMLAKKEDYDKLRESIIIFITEHDVLGDGLPLYTIERYINGKRLFNDGIKIIYVNASNQDAETKLGRLMHDFMCVPVKDMYYEELASRAKYLKSNKKGEQAMKSVWDEMQEESRAAGRAEGLEQGMAKGIAKGRAEGLEQGMQKGMQKGRAKGRAEGKSEAQENVVINMLKDGELALEKIAKYSGLTLKRVKELAKALA